MQRNQTQPKYLSERKKGYLTISDVGFMAMTMRKTALLDCVSITPLNHFLGKR